MSDAVTSVSEESIFSEASYVEVIADDLVRTASVIGILKSIGEECDELIGVLKFLTSELVMELHTNKYVDGLAAELRDAIKVSLWEVGDEFKLSTLINDVVSLGLMVREGFNDPELAKEVLEEFADTFSLQLSRCDIVREVMESGDPALILQTVLVGLTLAVGGLNYEGG